MGIDYTAHMMFGTTEQIKLPPNFENMFNDLCFETWEGVQDAIKEWELSKKDAEMAKDLVGFTLVLNGYDESFDGFGVEGKPGNVDEENVRKVFKKYGWGEPDWVTFVNQW